MGCGMTEMHYPLKAFATTEALVTCCLKKDAEWLC